MHRGLRRGRERGTSEVAEKLRRGWQQPWVTVKRFQVLAPPPQSTHVSSHGRKIIVFSLPRGRKF